MSKEIQQQMATFRSSKLQLFLTFFNLFFLISCNFSAPTSPWYTLGGNERQTYSSETLGPNSKSQILWHVSQPQSLSSPPQSIVVGPNGNVYWISNYYLYSIGTTGSINWFVSTGSFSYWKNVAISEDGNIVFARTNYRIPGGYDVAAFSSTNGNLLWASYPCDFWAEACSNLGLVLGHNTLFVGGVMLFVLSYDMYYAALDASNLGKSYWSFDTSGPSDNVAPLIYEEFDNIYTVNKYSNGKYSLVAYNWPNGDTQFEIDNGIYDLVYVIGQFSQIYILPLGTLSNVTFIKSVDSKRGIEFWNCSIPGYLVGTYCVNRLDTLVVVYTDASFPQSCIAMIDKSGKLLMTQPFPTIVSNLVVDSSLTVFFLQKQQNDFRLVALSSSSGKVLWTNSIAFNQTFSESPHFSLVLGDSTLYVHSSSATDERGHIWAI